MEFFFIAVYKVYTFCSLTQSLSFTLQEVDLGLMADVGTIQRLPKLVGNISLLRELVYTARKFYADEAVAMGMVR